MYEIFPSDVKTKKLIIVRAVVIKSKGGVDFIFTRVEDGLSALAKQYPDYEIFQVKSWENNLSDESFKETGFEETFEVFMRRTRK